MPVTNRRSRLLSANKDSVEAQAASKSPLETIPGDEEQKETAKVDTGVDVGDNEGCNIEIMNNEDDIHATGTTTTERLLTEDIFSLIYIGDYHSPSFHFAVFIFLFQLVATILIILDLIDSTSENNHLRVPVS